MINYNKICNKNLKIKLKKIHSIVLKFRIAKTMHHYKLNAWRQL